MIGNCNNFYPCSVTHGAISLRAGRSAAARVTALIGCRPACHSPTTVGTGMAVTTTRGPDHAEPCAAACRVRADRRRSSSARPRATRTVRSHGSGRPPDTPNDPGYVRGVPSPNASLGLMRVPTDRRWRAPVPVPAHVPWEGTRRKQADRAPASTGASLQPRGPALGKAGGPCWIQAGRRHPERAQAVH